MGAGRSFLLLLFLAAVGLAAGGPVADDDDDCISDRDEWWVAFESSSEARCVSPALMDTIQGPCDCPGHEYPCSDLANWSEARHLAWFSGSDALEDYLK